MNEPPRTITLGTRGSALARWQTEFVAGLLRRAWPDLDVHTEIITTHGDRFVDTPLPLIGGKGAFTAELETALSAGQIDFAVHSLKDLPTEQTHSLTVGAVPVRADARDALISRNGYTLATLPAGACVGTGSRRRAAQLLYRRPDLRIVDIRGNVDTRIRKVLDRDSAYDAILLACAGLERLGQMHVVSEILSLDDMLPAPGQGALAVQCRDDAPPLTLLAPINDPEVASTVAAERAFLAGLGGGCALPVSAYAIIEDGMLRLHGRVTAPNGSRQIDMLLLGAPEFEAARRLGAELAQMALEQGAAALLERLP